MVRAWFPRRRSHPMATQSLPTMATHAPPVDYLLDVCCGLWIASWRNGDEMWRIEWSSGAVCTVYTEG